jgi:hypothetical protein
MWEGRCVGVSVGKPKGRDHLEDLGVDGRIIYKKENPAQHRKNGRAVLTTIMITQIS